MFPKFGAIAECTFVNCLISGRERRSSALNDPVVGLINDITLSKSFCLSLESTALGWRCVACFSVLRWVGGGKGKKKKVETTGRIVNSKG